MRNFGPRHTAYHLAIVSLLICVVLPPTVQAASWFERLKQSLSGDEGADALLSTADLNSGLKEALRVGTQRVVGRLGQTDGFNLDPAIHISLPKELELVKDVLAQVGMESALTDLEVRLNRAAEIATPKAQELFFTAIADMTLEDVKGIYDGPENAATRYFEAKMSAPLALQMVPVVQASLADAGVVQAYTMVMAQYNDIPFVPQVDADLSQYVVDHGIEGIFFYLAKEEAAIRKDPAKRTTELLQRVFKNAE